MLRLEKVLRRVQLCANRRQALPAVRRAVWPVQDTPRHRSSVRVAVRVEECANGEAFASLPLFESGENPGPQEIAARLENRDAGSEQQRAGRCLKSMCLS